MKNPVAQSLEALARRVDAMESQCLEDSETLAYHSMLCDALRNVTSLLAAQAGGDDVVDAIRLACAILADASPPDRKWANALATAWAGNAAGKGKARKTR